MMLMLTILLVFSLMMDANDRTDCFKRSFFNRIIPVWNSLPSNVRHITNYSSFISSLKRLKFEKMNTSFKCLYCNHIIIIL